MSKRLKDVIKRNPEPARGTLGTNPMDPWSAKAGLAEDNMLDKFLSSRGINPGFVSKDTKISHAKSSAFLKWKQEHTFEEFQINEDKWLDRFLSSRGVDPKFVTTDKKVSYAKSGEFAKWLRDHQSEEVQMEEVDKADTISFDIPLFIRVLELAREDVKDDMELHRITERLIQIRDKGTLTMDDYEFIAGIKKLKEELEMMHEVSGMGIRPMGSHTATQSDHDTVKKHLKNLMAIDSDEPTATSAVHRAIKKVSTAGKTSTKTRSKEVLSALIQKHHIPIDKEHRALLNTESVKPTSLQKFRAAAAQREVKHNQIEKDRQEKLHKDPSKVGLTPAKSTNVDMTSAIDRLEKHLNREEVVTEMDKTQTPPGRDNDGPFNGPDKTVKPTTVNKTKKDALKFLNRKLVTIKKKVTEAVFQDPQAATQSPSDGANNPNEVSEKKRQMSKSARMIKSLYKNKKMTEAADGQSGGGITFDKEKTDKGETTYGKKPKIALTDKEDNVGENKPDALAVMSGGKTLTGQERDSVEIDPAMKKRPGQPDSGPKQDGKIR